MTDARMRLYAGPEDLRAMQRLTQRIWSPASQFHIGDQAWQRYQHLGREAEWPTALWERGGEVVAWGWAELPGFLERHGYARTDSQHFHSYMSHPLADLPDPVPPQGYTARPMRGEEDLARRVAVHQAAWHPSRVTEGSYRNVMATWPYRADLDWIIEAPSGHFAASCLIWLDEHNRVGELEPVGTDPRFRRRGLGRAVCLAAPHALRRAGARLAVVYPVQGHPTYPGAVPLYQGLYRTGSKAGDRPPFDPFLRRLAS